MKFIRRLVALLALASISSAACGQVVTLPQVNNAGGAKVASLGSVLIDNSGIEKGTAANPVVTAASGAAKSTACAVTATTSAATPTGCTATGSAGAYVVGPFLPQAGYPVRIVAAGTWTGSIAIGTSVDNCATSNPLTVAGQTYGSYTGNANEAVDVPVTSVAIGYCMAITVSSGTVTATLRQ